MSDPKNLFTVKVEAFRQPAAPNTVDANSLLRELQHWFQLEFEIWDIPTRHRVTPGLEFSPALEILEKSSAREQASERSPCDLIHISEQVGFLLLPLRNCGQEQRIAVAWVLLSLGQGSGQAWIESEAKRLGVEVTALQKWADQQDRWSERQLMQLAAHYQRDVEQGRKADQLKLTVDDLSEKISSTYEEISLLYSLTENLKITSSDRQLVELCLEGLLEVLPADSAAIQLLPPSDFHDKKMAQLL